MSILKDYINNTEKINKIEKITNTPSFYYSKNENNFHDIYIELNAPFKMIKLYHTNRLNIIQTGYDGISIHESNNFTHIINFNKIKLKDNFLLSYGNYSSFTRVVVYGWGQNSINATMSEMIEKRIDNDNNIVSSDSIKIEELKLEDFRTIQSAIINENKTIKGLYTYG